MRLLISLRPQHRLLFQLIIAAGILIPFAAEAPSSAAAATIQVPQDQPTIQAAIDQATPGDTVLVSAGTYRERITLKAGIIVKSAGEETKGKLGLQRAEATIIDGNFDGAEGPGVTMAEDATIDGFTVTGVGEYDDEKWNKHHATHGEQQSHEHIGAPGTAGISVIGVTRCTVKNNIVHHIGYTGIAVMGEAGKRVAPHIFRNVTYRNMGGGIGSMKKSAALIEENTCFENFYAGIGHDDASPLVISNVCYENIRAGIGVSEHSKPIVRGNKCYRNRRAGIGIRTGKETQPIVEDNDCYENDMAGIGTREEASPIIRNNRCYRNKLAGIGSRTHATPTIIGNECYENEKAGIGQMSDAVTVLIGNYSHHNKRAGIGFDNSTEGRSTVINNRVVDNALVAVGIHSGWTVQLSGNELSRQGGLPPIVMVFAGSEATFSDNVIRGGGVAGVRVAGTVHLNKNEFDGTSLRKVGPPNFAVWALPGANVTMTANKVHGWRHALQGSEATVTANGNTISQFHRAAFVIQKPASPANVYGNTAVSDDANAKVVTIDGDSGIVENNKLVSEADKKP
jgi:hypothetical protein